MSEFHIGITLEEFCNNFAPDFSGTCEKKKNHNDLNCLYHDEESDCTVQWQTVDSGNLKGGSKQNPPTEGAY